MKLPQLTNIRALCTVVLIAGLTFTACTDNTLSSIDDQDNTLSSIAGQEMLSKGKPQSNDFDGNAGDGVLTVDNNGYGVYEYQLWAGKTMLAGTVSITSDDENLLVNIDSNDDSDIDEVHIYVWTDLSEIPDRRPAPGKAPYKAENVNADSYSMSISMDQNNGETFYISVHTAMTSGETAYAGGSNTADGYPNVRGAWWGYVSYIVDECECVEVNLINGSFEEGNNPDESGVGEFELTGWDSNFGRVGGYPIDWGSYGIDLIGTGTSVPGWVEQTITTQVGKEYALSFGTQINGSQGRLVVTVDGNTQNFTTGSHTITFTATSTSTTIRFEANAYYNYLGNNVFLDNISISCN